MLVKREVGECGWHDHVGGAHEQVIRNIRDWIRVGGAAPVKLPPTAAMSRLQLCDVGLKCDANEVAAE